MIIIDARDGQMCNQLLTIAAAYALGLEYDENVKCPIANEKLKNDFYLTQAPDSPIRIEVYYSHLWKIINLFEKFLVKLGLYKPQLKYIIVIGGEKKRFRFSLIGFHLGTI